MLHIFGKAAQMHDVLLKLRPSDKGAAPLLTDGEPAGLQPVERLSCSHSAYPIEARQFLFGSERVSCRKLAGVNHFHESPLNLVIQRYEAAFIQRTYG